MGRLVDLSHTVTDGLETYPGLPGPRITEYLSFEDSRDSYDGAEFSIARIEMIANTGTYMDMPAHRHRGGDDLADASLERVANLPGVVVDPSTAAVGPGDLDGLDLRSHAVLLRTGWDRHFATAEYAGPESPHLTAEGAHALVDAGAALVGIDSINIDALDDCTRPAHTLLLDAGIPIVEHMTGLDELPEKGFSLHAAPVKVAGMATFPVRVFAVVD